ncbi:MAG: tetratricopeptide repeat protein [Terriglobia bacterium]
MPQSFKSKTLRYIGLNRGERERVTLFPVSLVFLLLAFAAARGIAVPQSTRTPALEETWLAEGSQALARGDAVAAEAAFRRALAVDPHSVGILNDLAIALVQQKKTAEAIPLYQRALALRPGDPTTTRNLAIAYFREQRYRSALPLFKSLTRKMPGDFQAASLTGLSLFALNRYVEAAQYLDRASRIKPSDLPTLYMLGQADLRDKNFGAMTGVFARISKLAPDSAEADVMMGTAYDKAFQEQSAIEEYQAAEKADPNFPGVHSGLGLLYWKRGDTQRAKAEFQQEL